jgi:hypothetical protein
MTAPTAPDNDTPEQMLADDDQLPTAPAPTVPSTTGRPGADGGAKTKKQQLAPLKLGPVMLAAALLLAIIVAVTYRLLGPVWGSVVLAGLAVLIGIGVWLWRRRANRRGRRGQGGHGDGKGGGPLGWLRRRLPGGGRDGSGRRGGTGGGAGGGKKGPLAALRRALGRDKNGQGRDGTGKKRGGPLGALRRALGGGPGRGAGKGSPGGSGRGRGPGSGGRGRGSGGGSGRGKGKAPWWWPFPSGDSKKTKKRTKNDGVPTESGPCNGPGPSGKDKKKPDDKPASDKPDNKTKPGGGTTRPPSTPPAPQRRRTGGFNMGARLDDAGLLRFGESLKQDPEKLNSLRDWYKQKAEAADENPVNEGVTDTLHAIANLMGRAAELAGGLYDQYTTGNEADIHRNQNPRRGEEKADVSYNNRDQ